MVGAVAGPDMSLDLAERVEDHLAELLTAGCVATGERRGRDAVAPACDRGVRSPHGQVGASSTRKTPGSASGAMNVAYTVAGLSVMLRTSPGSSPDSTKADPFGEPGP